MKPSTNNRCQPIRALALACLLCAAFCLGQASMAGAQGGFFGMGVYLVRVMGDEPLMEQVAGLAAQSNAGWTREDFIWANIEPQRGQYDEGLLEHYSRMLDEAQSRGLSVLGILVYNNPWSSGENAPSTPEQYQDFADFAAFVVNRFKDRVKHWEVWNEPNNSRFWKPAPSPADYAELLKYTYQAIKAADPDAKVVGCVSVADDLAFVTSVLMAGGGDYLDIVSLHPYPQPGPLEWSREALNILLIRAILPGLGVNKPIWLTELGYSTYRGDKGVSQRRQAQLLVRAYLTALSLGVEMAMWYDFRDDGVDPDRIEDNFGLITNQSAFPPLIKKPAFYAFRNLVFQVEGYRAVKAYLLGEDVVGLSMINSYGLRKLAVWVVDQSETYDSKPLELKVSGQARSVSNIYGDPWDVDQREDVVYLSVSGSPIYITGDMEPKGYPEASLASLAP